MINDMDKKVIKRKTKKGIYMKIMGKAAYQQRKGTTFTWHVACERMPVAALVSYL